MQEATLDRWMTMRMLTPEVGELDVDGYRISVVERPVAKYDEMDPDFEYTVRITKLRDVAPLRRPVSSDDMADALRATIPVVEEMFNVPLPSTFGKERQKKAERQRDQARYMASLRFLPARAKEAAKRIYREKGVKAATAYAQSVVRPKGKAK